MFWVDKTNSFQSSETKEPTKVIAEWYRRMDDMVGRVVSRIGNEEIPKTGYSNDLFINN